MIYTKAKQNIYHALHDRRMREKKFGTQVFLLLEIKRSE